MRIACVGWGTLLAAVAAGCGHPSMEGRSLRPPVERRKYVLRHPGLHPAVARGIEVGMVVPGMMRPEHVKAMCGEPGKVTRQKGGIETWYYYTYKILNNQRKAFTYWVIFRNGVAIGERSFMGGFHLK